MNRRTLKFYRHPVQKKYLRLVLFAMICPTLLVTSCLYYLIWQTVAYELAIPELIMESLFPAFAQVNLILLVGVPVIFILVFIFAVRLAHRFAGPLYRIESELDNIIETKNFKKPIHIRQKDALHSLVSKINQLLVLIDQKPH